MTKSSNNSDPFTLHYATTNTGKLQGLSNLMSEYPITILPISMKIPEYQIDDVEEIALQKVTTAYEFIKKPVVAHDSGFYIDALNGFPKAYAKFINETIVNSGLLRLVKGKPRTCSFKSSMAYMDSTLKNPIMFLNTIPGTMADKEYGTLQNYALSNLWLIFRPLEYNKTLAQFTKEEITMWRENSYDSTKLLRDWLVANKL